MDNSGARYVECIKTLGGFNRKYSYAGDYILISIKKLRLVRKVKVGQVLMGLITRTSKETKFLDGSYIKCQQNVVLVMTRKNRLLGTRFFGWVSRKLRRRKFLRIIIIAGKHVL